MSDIPKVDETIEEEFDEVEETDGDPMFRVAMNTVKDHSFYADDYDEDKHGDIVFADLDQLDNAFKEEKKVLYWEDEPIALVRKLAPGEVTDISNALISRRVAVAMAMATPGTKKDAESQVDYAREQGEKQYDVLVKSVQRAVLEPKGLNEKRIRKWSRRKLEFAFRFVTGVTEFDSVDMFHQLDKQTEKQSTGDTPDADSDG